MRKLFLPHENMETSPQKLANLQKCSSFLYLVQICGYIVHTGYPIYVVVAIFELDMQAMLIRSNVRGTNCILSQVEEFLAQLYKLIPSTDFQIVWVSYNYEYKDWVKRLAIFKLAVRLRTSGASKNRDWTHENGGLFPFCVTWCYLVLLVLGSLFLTNF